MTIQNTTLRKAGPSQGNGVTTVFPFTFKVFTATDILVTYLNALGVESVLVLSTNYTVSLNADQNTSPGGSVTLLVAPATATYITLTSQVTNTQNLSLTNSGGFYPQSINDALDRTVIEIQQLAEQASRSITIPKSSTASPLLPVPTPLNVLAWNVDATAITNVSLESSSNLSSYKATGTGAVTRTVASKLNDTVSVKDFGATGDGITDDTAAINLAITATTSGKALFFPAGNYLFTSTLTFSANNICIYGAGSFQTVLTYGGANTTNNIININSGSTQIVNYVIHGIRIMSNTTMTAGSAVYAKGLCRSFIYDFSIGSSEIASPKVWSGIWFDSTDNVYLSNYQINPQNIGLRVNGAIGSLPKAGLFVNLGRIIGGITGIHVAGAFGGLYIDQSDIIAMTGDGVLIDNAIVAEGNREVFLGANLSIDSCGGNGVNINDIIGTNQTFKLSGTWVASCANHGIYVQAASAAVVIIDGCRIFNHTNDGIRSNTASGATIIVDSCSIANCGGYGANGTSSGNATLLLGSNSFTSCTLGNTNYVSPLPMVDVLITKATSGSRLQIANLASGILNAQQISNVAYNQTRSSDTDYNAGGTLFVGVSQNGITGTSADMWNSTSGYLGASFIGFSGYTASSSYQGDIRFFTKINGATTEKVRVDPQGNTYIEVGTLWQYAPTPTSISTTTSLAAVVLTTGIINTTGTSYTVTLPLASDIDVVYPYVPTTNIGFDFHVVNTASGTITIAVNTGITSLGALTVSTLTSATFRLRRTAASTYKLIRLS